MTNSMITLTANSSENVNIILRLLDENQYQEVCDLFAANLEKSLSHSQASSLLEEVIKKLDDPYKIVVVLDKIYHHIIKAHFKEYYNDLYLCLIRRAFRVETNHFVSILEACCKVYSLPEICKHLSESFSGEASLKTLIKLSSPYLPSAFTQELLFALISQAFEFKNLRLLAGLEEAFPFTYNDLIENKLVASNDNILLPMLAEINKVKDVDYRNFIIETINQYLCFGRLTYQGGLVYLAAVAGKKRQIKPTLLKQEDLLAYFKTLNEYPLPFNEKFIISGVHWISGVITRNELNQTQIFIVDSLGAANLSLGIDIDGVMEVLNKTFQNIKVFIAFEKKQKAILGCSFFSIDDALHYYSVEKYLDKTKYPNGLFDYLEKNQESKATIDSKLITISYLPLHLLRTMQSTSLLQRLANSSDSHLPLNKKGHTGIFLNQHKYGFQLTGNSKLINKRIEVQQAKMIKKCLTYLLDSDYNIVCEETKARTLTGFKNRLKQLFLLEKHKKQNAFNFKA